MWESENVIEFHVDGGEYFHMLIKFKSSRLRGSVKEKFMQDYNVSINCKTKSCRYVSAYRYVMKEERHFGSVTYVGIAL